MRIFGIDPGSERTGYGCVETDGRRHHLVACGAIAASPGDTFPHRLGSHSSAQWFVSAEQVKAILSSNLPIQHFRAFTGLGNNPTLKSEWEEARDLRVWE